jgi:Flp pilus assembly pilin Flp
MTCWRCAVKKIDFPLGRLLARIHRDERGGVSIETILIIAAIALPILIFLIKIGWPRVKGFFDQGMTDLEAGSGAAQQP